ncbi:MAG: hypothetical protein ACYTAF_01915 [Planctomycetota bacterium]|jgi:hypothetical protein
MRGEAVRLGVFVSLHSILLILAVSCGPVAPAPDTGGDSFSGKPRPAGTQRQPTPPPSTPPARERAQEPEKTGQPTWGKQGSNNNWSFKGGNAPQEVPKEGHGQTQTSHKPQNEVIKRQQRIVAEKPNNDVERMKLAALLMLNRDYPEAEGVLTGVRDRSHSILPFLEVCIFKGLGEYKAALDRIEQIMLQASAYEGFKIQRADLCTLIAGYRRYVRNEESLIQPGGVALIYVEPRNFSLKMDNGLQKMWLEYDWKLYNDRMEEIAVPVWTAASASDKRDTVAFQGPVREFYQSFRLPLPSNLSVGEYRIKVTVYDRNQERSDSVYVPFRVPAVMGK